MEPLSESLVAVSWEEFWVVSLLGLWAAEPFWADLTLEIVVGVER